MIRGPMLASRFDTVGTRAVGTLITPLRPSYCWMAALKLLWIWSLIGTAIPLRVGSRRLISCLVVSVQNAHRGKFALEHTPLPRAREAFP